MSSFCEQGRVLSLVVVVGNCQRRWERRCPDWRQPSSCGQRVPGYEGLQEKGTFENHHIFVNVSKLQVIPTRELCRSVDVVDKVSPAVSSVTGLPPVRKGSQLRGVHLHIPEPRVMPGADPCCSMDEVDLSLGSGALLYE